MKRKLPAVVLILTGLLPVKSFSQKTANEKVISIANTVWSGNDSDGDFHEFTFLAGGHIRLRSNTMRKDTATFSDTTDRWFQQGNEIVFILNDYVTYSGKIEQGHIRGKSWNVTGKRWTWTFTLKQPAPAVRECELTEVTAGLFPSPEQALATE